MSSDLTFLTNEQGNTLRDRFHVLLGEHTRLFDILVGYFYVSGFHQLYPSLESTERIRILIGLRTDRSTVDLLDQAKEEQGQLDFHSQAEAKEAAQKEVFQELQESKDTSQIEDGVRKFVDWVKSEKLQIR